MECGSILLSQGQMRRGKGKKGIPLQRGVLEQVRGNVDTGCGAQMMRKSDIAMRDGSSEKDAEKKRNHQNGLEKIREACEKVAREEIGGVGIVQENF